MVRQTNRLGFTLLELVLVLLILATCAAIAAPSLKGFANGRLLPNTASSLVTTAMWCRVQAINDGVAYRLNLDTQNRKWWVTKDDGMEKFVTVTAVYGEEFTLPTGLTMTTDIHATDGGTYLEFDAVGRGDVGTIRLEAGQAYLEVVCDTPLGTPHIVKPPGSP